MKRSLILALIGVFTLTLARAATLCSGNSSATSIDLTKGARVAAATETIRYSAAWETTASGATANVAVNGTTLKSATGTGSVAWKPTRNGTYTLEHKVTINEVQVGSTLSAVFVVEGLPEETRTTEVAVPFSWIETRFPTVGSSVEALEKKANETAANGHKVWECYVAGEDPTNSASKFAAEITVGEDGKPSISWNPDLGEERVYKILGSTDLKTWEVVPEGEEATYNFFKVTVEMK